MLTKGRPTVAEKAIVLCIFQRGLDSSSFCDRFNFEAWNQLISYFKTDNVLAWDLNQCPIPITLERMKTEFEHEGFIDHDALEALVEYISEVRIPQFGKIQSGEAMILTTKGQPYKTNLCYRLIPKLAKRAKIQKKLEGYLLSTKNEKTTHELRDTLDSTLTSCCTDGWVVDVVTGHVPKSSYRKSHIMFSKDMKMEYSKASKKINILSKVTNYIKNQTEIEDKLKGKNDTILKLEKDVSKLQNQINLIILSKTRPYIED